MASNLTDANGLSPALMLPADVLIAIASYSARTLATMVQTCSVWNHQIKGALASLSPAYLDAPYAPGHDFMGVNSLCLSLLRTKAGSLVMQPLRQLLPGASMDWSGGLGTAVHDLGSRFTTLKTLDLSGQVLVSGLLTSLTRQPTLSTLQLGGCTLHLQELATGVLRMSQLQSLGLAGVRAVEASAQPTVPTPQALLRAAALRKNAVRMHLPPPAPVPYTGQQPAFAAALTQLLTGLSQLPKLAHLDLSQLPAVRASAAPGHPPFVGFDGLPVYGFATALTALTSLTSLHMRANQLSLQEVAHIGACTRLLSLSLCWPAATWVEQDRVNHSHDHVLIPFMWAEGVQRLTNLRALSVDMYGCDTLSYDARMGMSVAGLTQLTSLSLEGCFSVGLALSIMRLKKLRVLGLVHSDPLVASPELVVQVVSALPQLEELDVSHSKIQPRHELFGDVLIRGLSLVRPELRVLNMTDCNIFGTGLAPVQCLPSVQKLTLGGSHILACKYQTLGSLSTLSSLTLTGVLPRTFVAAAKSGGYQELSRLTALTELRILSTPYGLPPGPGGIGGGGGNVGAGPGGLNGPGGAPGPAGPPPQVPPVPAWAMAQAQAQQLQAAMAVQAAMAAQGLPMLGPQVAPPPVAAPPPFNPLAVFDEDEDEEDEDEGEDEAGAGGQAGPAGGIGGGALMDDDQSDDEEGGEVGEDWGDEDDFEDGEAEDDDMDGDEEGPGEMVAVGGGALPLQLPGQAGVLSAVAASQNRYREPHLHFVTFLPQLQVLVLQSLQSNGTCLRHLASLSGLTQLKLQGVMGFTWAGIECLAMLRLPSLEAFSLGVCSWGEPEGSSSQGGGRSSSSGSATAAAPSGSGPVSMSMSGMSAAASAAAEHVTATSCVHHAGVGPNASDAGPSTSKAAAAWWLAAAGSAPQSQQPSAQPGVVHLLSAVRQAMPGLQALQVDGCAGMTLGGLATLTTLATLRYLSLSSLPPRCAEDRAAIAATLSRSTSLQFVHATSQHMEHGPGFMLLRTRGALTELGSVVVPEADGEVVGGGGTQASTSMSVSMLEEQND